jgi:hypothetical protein
MGGCPLFIYRLSIVVIKALEAFCVLAPIVLLCQNHWVLGYKVNCNSFERINLTTVSICFSNALPASLKLDELRR